MAIYMRLPDIKSLSYTTVFNRQPPSSGSQGWTVNFSTTPSIIGMVIGSWRDADLNIYASNGGELLYSFPSFGSGSDIGTEVRLSKLIGHNSVYVQLVSHGNIGYHQITFYYE